MGHSIVFLALLSGASVRAAPHDEVAAQTSASSTPSGAVGAASPNALGEAQPGLAGMPVDAGGRHILPPGFDLETGKRSYLQAVFNKIRPGSMLKAETPMTAPTVPWATPLGDFADAQIKSHYGRMAQLDAIAEVASREHSVSLAERVESVRRKEMQRFFAAMQWTWTHVARASEGAAWISEKPH